MSIDKDRRNIEHPFDGSLHYEGCESLKIFTLEEGKTICEPCDCDDREEEFK